MFTTLGFTVQDLINELGEHYSFALFIKFIVTYLLTRGTFLYTNSSKKEFTLWSCEIYVIEIFIIISTYFIYINY